MQHVDRIVPFRDVDDTPLAQHMNTDLLDPRSDTMHRLPVARLQSILNRAEFETRRSARLIREVPEVVQTGTYESEWLHCHTHII